MPRHVVCPVAEIPPGSRRLTEAGGRSIVIFNLAGEFFGLLNRCPHQGGTLAQGTTSGLVEAPTPGDYRYTRPGEILRCPWHGWEFDIRTGKSRCQPERVKARSFAVETLAGPEAAELHAETIPVAVDQNYVVVEC